MATPGQFSVAFNNLVALRDIEAGEELTIDYQMTLWFTPE
jgi:SET domain-containing protein